LGKGPPQFKRFFATKDSAKKEAFSADDPEQPTIVSEFKPEELMTDGPTKKQVSTSGTCKQPTIASSFQQDDVIEEIPIDEWQELDL